MMKFIQEHTDLLIIISICAVVLAVAVVLLSILVFKPLGLKKQLRVLDRKYHYCHSLLVGQNSQNVKKLEIISRTNLLYVETHTKFLRRYKEITINNDEESLRAVNNLKDILNDKDFKEFKISYKNALKIISDYENVLQQYTNDLSKVVQPEDDCRQAILEQKEHFRSIKQEYFSKESELSVMSESFEQLFTYIDSLFNKFEGFVDSAQYDDANGLLPEVSGFLSELDSKIKDLPELCILITNIVPEKIHNIENLYKEMIENRFPLQNLYVNQTLAIIDKSLGEFLQKIKRFETEGIKNEINKIIDKLDGFITSFDKEKQDREIFIQKSEPVYKTLNDVENRFIKLRNELPELSDVFVINEEHQDIIKNLQKDVNRVGGLKRTLDTYIHSATKQPYSLLVSKIIEIESLNKVIDDQLENFNSYLETLKKDSEVAYATVYSTFDKIKKAEELIRLMNLETINKRYEGSIEQLYSLLSQTNETLMVQPIDVEKVNALIADIYELSNKLLDEGEIAQDYNMMVLAENSIIYGNKHRNNLTEIDQLLSQSEIFFNDGKFEEAYKIAVDALRKIKQNNGK